MLRYTLGASVFFCVAVGCSDVVTEGEGEGAEGEGEGTEGAEGEGEGEGEGIGDLRLVASPFRIAPGQASTLRWSGAGTAALSLSTVGTVTDLNEVVVRPATTTLYTLTASSADGERTATASVIVGSEPTDAPAWRDGMAPFSWKKLPTTNLMDLTPDPFLIDSVDSNGLPVLGGLYGRVSAWVGLAADPSTSRVYSAANGGHGDWAGNEVYELDLRQDVPTWVMLRAPTAPEYIFRGDYNFGVYPDYYLDDRPGSTHSYYALQFLPSFDSVFRFGAGSLYGTGNEANNHIDAFVLADNDWVAAGTYPDITPTRTDAIAVAVCRNTVNDDVYVAATGRLRRFNAATSTVEELSGYIQNHTAMSYAACAVDSVRDRVVYFGDQYRPAANGGLVYDILADAFSEITFTGEATTSVTSWREAYAYHDPVYDTFFPQDPSSGRRARACRPDRLLGVVCHHHRRRSTTLVAKRCANTLPRAAAAGRLRLLPAGHHRERVVPRHRVALGGVCVVSGSATGVLSRDRLGSVVVRATRVA
jgi:hypothetical protein